MQEWFYQGKYGQVGPITEDQVKELADLGGITADTYLWREGMVDWSKAAFLPEVKNLLPACPPPPPDFQRNPPPVTSNYGMGAQPHMPQSMFIPSKRSPYVAGLLNFVVPGLGRFYLGYFEIGLLQFCLSCLGIGIIWSWFDGFTMFFGAVKFDADGKSLFR